MTRFFLILFSLFSTLFLGAQEVAKNEFVQPKKTGKRISLDTLKRNNIESCSQAFDLSASLVEELGGFQKTLKACFDEVVHEDTRTYHSVREPKLTQMTHLLGQMEDLIVACKECLHS